MNQNGETFELRESKCEANNDDPSERYQVLLTRARQYLRDNSPLIDSEAYYENLKVTFKDELKRIAKLEKDDPTFEKFSNQLTASNYTFYESLWKVAKTCTGVTSVLKKFDNKDSSKGSVTNKRTYGTTDIVAGNGTEWVKVSTISEQRLMWELVKAGYDGADFSSDEDDEDGEEEPSPMTSLTLYKQVAQLISIARSKILRSPKIRLVLVRVSEKEASKNTRELLSEIRKLGVEIQTMDDLPEVVDLDEAMPRMAPFEKVVMDRFTDTLVLDCTLLVSLCSDITWKDVTPQDWYVASFLYYNSSRVSEVCLVALGFLGGVSILQLHFTGLDNEITSQNSVDFES